MNMLTTILLFLLTLVILLGVYALCRKFIFNKIHINKWIPLSIFIVLLGIQAFLPINNIYIRYVYPFFPVMFLLWFFDIIQNGSRKKKEKPIVIKPKAKPNRVKKKDK